MTRLMDVNRTYTMVSGVISRLRRIAGHGDPPPRRRRVRNPGDARPLRCRHRHGGPGTQRPGHLEQHREPADHRLQAPDPPISRICSTRTYAGPVRRPRTRIPSFPPASPSARASRRPPPPGRCRRVRWHPRRRNTTSPSAARGLFRVTMPDGRIAFTRDGLVRPLRTGTAGDPRTATSSIRASPSPTMRPA